MMVTMMVAVMRYAGERWGHDRDKQQYSNEFLHDRKLSMYFGWRGVKFAGKPRCFRGCD
jgi:hypothetical protein